MKRGSLSHERACCLPQPSETKAPLANSPELGQCSHPSPGALAGQDGARHIPAASSAPQAVAPAVSGSNFSISHRQGERGPELLISLSAAWQASQGTQRCVTGPRFVEVQREICYLVGETLS